MSESGAPPDWLGEPAAAVLSDLHGGVPVGGIRVIATSIGDMNGLSLELVDVDERTRVLPQLVDDLDATPDESLGAGGGNFVPRPLAGPRLLVRVAEILQEDLAETSAAWGQARPPCPYHPHPAAAALCDGEAWWICPRSEERLYRIGRGEVPARRQPATRWSEHNTKRKTKRRNKRR